ncbi:YceI family protein [Sphingomonas bisphenolicum]
MRFSSVFVPLLALSACVQQPENEDVENASTAAGNAAMPGQAQVELQVPAGRYKLDPYHSSMEWSVHHADLANYWVNFTKYDATISLDPQNLEKSGIELTIDPTGLASHYTGNALTHKTRDFKSWDEELAFSDKFLNAGKFSRISFKSTKVERSGPSNAKVTGNLTFLGVSRPVAVDVTLTGQTARHMMTGNAAIGVHAEASFNRHDFGMAKFPGLGEIVKLRFDGEFQADKPAAVPTPAPAVDGKRDR